MRKAPAAELRCEDEEYMEVLWMNERAIKLNMAEFGQHPELTKALEHYRTRKEFPDPHPKACDDPVTSASVGTPSPITRFIEHVKSDAFDYEIEQIRDPWWDNADKFQDWRNYVDGYLRDSWEFLDDVTRYCIFYLARNQANGEVWKNDDTEEDEIT